MTRFASSSPSRLERTLTPGVIAIVLLFVAILAVHRDYIPYWDAKAYFDCIVNATDRPFNPLNFRCVTHPSVVYLVLLGLARYLTPWNPALIYGVNALLGAVSIVAFHRLVRALFPAATPIECDLATALYAFAPLFTVHAVFLNVDYGMTAFFVLFLAGLFYGRFWMAGLAAAAMMLSKEMGAAAFAISLVAFIVAFTLYPSLTSRARIAGLRAQLPLLVAPLFVAAYIVVAHGSGNEPWIGAYLPLSLVHDRAAFYLTANPGDASMQAFLADIFILNIQWIYTAVIGLAGCAALLRRLRDGHGPLHLNSGGLFIGLVTAGLAYAVSRYRIYNNPRYILIVSPLLVLAFFGSLLSFCRSSAVRLSVLTAAGLLVLISNFRTIDPVSRRVFGTFSFGTHLLLDVPSFTHGSRMDSIVYNFESLQFHYLLTDLMHDLRPTARTVLFMGDTTYNFPPAVDARTFDLTLDRSHAVSFSILSGDGDVDSRVLRAHHLADGDRFFYLALPNADNHQLRLLRDRYPVTESKQYNRHGYTLDLYTFVFRS